MLRKGVLRWGRLSFALAGCADWVRNRWLGVLGTSARTQVVDGVEFPVPGIRGQDRRSYYRDRLLLVRFRSAAVAWPYPRVASGPAPSALRPPIVLATFHVGPLTALGALVARLPGPASVFLNSATVPTRTAMLLDTEGGEGQRIAATTEAARILRGGGFTLLVVDGLGTAQVPATIFGRAVSLSAGAFALARLSDAPILPVAVRWHGGAVRITAGAPISPGEATEMAAALARWLETYLREHPGELTFTVAKLLRAAGTT